MTHASEVLPGGTFIPGGGEGTVGIAKVSQTRNLSGYVITGDDGELYAYDDHEDVPGYRAPEGAPVSPGHSYSMGDLEDSIKRHGILVPIMLDTDGNVLDGHHRLEIADRHDIWPPMIVWPTIPTEDQIVLIRVRQAIEKQFRIMGEKLIEAEKALNDIVYRFSLEFSPSSGDDNWTPMSRHYRRGTIQEHENHYRETLDRLRNGGSSFEYRVVATPDTGNVNQRVTPW